MTELLIETHGLSRDFTVKMETVSAVRGLDLSVAEGELVAVLGPNGAGKSTTLRLLTTLLPPTAGTARVAGLDVVRRAREVRQQIGFIGQGNGAGHSQLGRDELLSQGRCYGMAPDAARARADELIDSLDLSEVVGRKVSTLSGGQRRRLDIAMGLIHSPRLLFLDEPSTGLDPQSRANLREHIRTLRADHGATVVFSTHYLDEADSLAERVVVIDGGRVIADDTPARLKATHAHEEITMTFDTDEDARLAGKLVAQLAPEASSSVDAGRLSVRVPDAPRLLPRLLPALSTADIAVRTADVTRPTLDDVFLNLTGRSLREEVAA
jgi:ABC-2 type transport system ATP-binding protein